MSDKPVAAANDDDVLDIFNEFAVSDEAVAVPYKGVEFLIARDGNSKYRRRLAYFYEKNKRVLDGKGQATEEKSNEIMATVMAEAILVGWNGTIAFKGEKLAYSKENAAKLLSVQTFREWVAKQSRDEELYKVVKDKEDVENF